MVFIFDISEKHTCSIELILQFLNDYVPASFKYFYTKKNMIRLGHENFWGRALRIGQAVGRSLWLGP